MKCLKCHRNVVARGLCDSCYHRTAYRVKKMETTWEDETAAGLATASKVKRHQWTKHEDEFLITNHHQKWALCAAQLGMTKAMATSRATRLRITKLNRKLDLAILLELYHQRANKTRVHGQHRNGYTESAWLPSIAGRPVKGSTRCPTCGVKLLPDAECLKCKLETLKIMKKQR